MDLFFLEFTTLHISGYLLIYLFFIYLFFSRKIDLDKFDKETQYKICIAMATVDDVSKVPMKKISEKLKMCRHCTVSNQQNKYIYMYCSVVAILIKRRSLKPMF